MMEVVLTSGAIRHVRRHLNTHMVAKLRRIGILMKICESWGDKFFFLLLFLHEVRICSTVIGDRLLQWSLFRTCSLLNNR